MSGDGLCKCGHHPVDCCCDRKPVVSVNARLLAACKEEERAMTIANGFPASQEGDTQ